MFAVTLVRRITGKTIIAPPLDFLVRIRYPDQGILDHFVRLMDRARHAVAVCAPLPPLIEALGLAEMEHNALNNRMRAI
jgi:hypothetical protein